MKTISTMRAFATIGACFLVACSGAPDERTDAPAASQPAPASAAAVSTVGPVLSGYRPDVLRSRAVLGAHLRTIADGSWTRFVGDDGALSVASNGSLLASVNATSPARRVPFRGTAAEHDRLVREYFVSTGIPADQIGFTSIQTNLSASGRTGEPAPKPHVDGFATVLHRRIDGFDVAGSVAVAELNGSGDVLSESVYWPDIPRRVIDEAKALAAHANGGHVVVRHSPSTARDFEVAAVIDVVEGANVRHLGADGRELRFAYERE